MDLRRIESAARAAAAALFAFLCTGCDAEQGGASPAPSPSPSQSPLLQKPMARPGSAEFMPYRQPIPGTAAGFDMMPVPGGVFVMGSPPDEPGRSAEEGPQVAVVVEPFWIGRFEVTWEEYDCWTADATLHQTKEPKFDALARPTPPYTDMTFGMGREGFPAICMSHLAARRYCAWLTKKTGRFHRLPTEAEWERAARGGSTAAYSFGQDPKDLDAHAVHAGNAKGYAKVGTKAPNAYGLHDAHGNVAEWVADRWIADAYAETHGKAPRENPFFPPALDKQGRPARFPHAVRGGGWQDPPERLRSAARRSSDPAWNARDPQVPRSWWYLTEAQNVGFRVVRPFREPTPEERAKFELP